MEMVSINSEMIFDCGSVKIDGANGMSIEVKKQIPYDEKESFSLQYALYRNVEDTENEIMYDNYKNLLIKTMLIAKYYTNINVAELKDESDWAMMFDVLTSNDLYGQMMSIVADDMVFVDAISESMLKSVREIYVRGNSLQFNLKKAFGFLFTGEDLTESIAKAAEVSNEVTELIGANKELEKVKGKQNDKLITNNGVVLNMAKKRTGKNKE